MAPQNAILSGATIGLMIAAPIGPMAILCLKRTLSAGFRAGLSTGAGASTIHLAYSGLALLGLQQASLWLTSHRGSLGMFAAAIMLLFAARALRRRPAGISAPAASRRSLLGHYLSAVAFNSLNPMLLVLLVGAMTSILVPRQSVAGAEPALLLFGVFLGSFAWWFALSSVVAFVGSWLDARVVRVIDISVALAMAGFGVAALARSVGQ